MASIKLSSAVRASVTMDSPTDIVRRVIEIIGNRWNGECRVEVRGLRVPSMRQERRMDGTRIRLWLTARS
jgi:hypothetical protein